MASSILMPNSDSLISALLKTVLMISFKVLFQKSCSSDTFCYHNYSFGMFHFARSIRIIHNTLYLV
jgi:hypothetical protein